MVQIYAILSFSLESNLHVIQFEFRNLVKSKLGILPDFFTPSTKEE